MTRNEFNELCETHLIQPTIALENGGIVQALLERNDERVIEILETEF